MRRPASSLRRFARPEPQAASARFRRPTPARGGLGAALVLGCVVGCSHAGSATAGPDGSTTPGVCIGVTPPASAWAAEPSGSGPADAGESDAGPPLGGPPPQWALRDFQPQSCGYQATYGLEVLRGEVTLLAALESS
jgi:hypothetical protein